MATLDWQLTPTEDATLVELTVTSDADARVEIESSLQPVWPPRRQNRPAAGWDDSGFEGTVTAGEPLVLGYASPDDPVEPPATIVETEPVPEDSGGPPTPDDLVRALGDARPPRDAVPTRNGSATPDDSPSGDVRATARSSPLDPSPDHAQPVDDSSHRDHPPDEHAAKPPESSSQEKPFDDPVPPDRDGQPRDRSPADHTSPDRDTPSNDRSAVDPGESMDDWLEAVDRRVETAQRLAAVETAEEARAAVRAAGGIDRVRALCERLDADRARMERTETRRAALDQQLADVDVPLSALERLA